MAGRRREPSLIQQAHAMRLAGYSLASISEQLSVSPRTLSRYFSAAKVRRGEARASLVQSAREQLLRSQSATDEIAALVAAQISDDLAHGRKLREHVLLALERLEVDTHAQAVDTTRALSALSTVLKNTQAVMRTTLGIDQREETNAPVTELIIRDMISEEIIQVRRSHSAVGPSLDDEEAA